MVVQCQSCQARFRVADDKVTERGVRVRCTGCRTVFLVKKDGSQAQLPGQAPTGDTVLGMAPLSSQAGAPASSPAAPRPAGSAPPAAGQRSAPPGRAAAAPTAGRLSAPPLAGARAGTPATALRPNTLPTAPPRPSLQPRTSAPPSLNGASKRPPADDPFGMAELTGEPAPSKPSPPRPPASRPPPSGASPTGLRARSGNLSDGLDLDLGGGNAPGKRPITTPPPSGNDAAPLAIGKLGRAKVFPDEPQAPKISQPPPPPPLWDEDDPSISLEEKPVRNGATSAPGFGPKPSVPPPPPRTTPPPQPSAASRAASLDPSSEARSGLHDPFAGMELDAEGGPQAPLSPSDPALAKLPSAPPPKPKPSEPPAHAEAHPAAEAEPSPPPRSARRQIVSSALTGLIGAALALLLAVGPSAFLSGHLSDIVGAGDLVAVQEATGLYDTISGRPVFFVRGRVENRGKGISGPVRIVATLVGEHGPTARAESLAGEQPGPEEVYGLRSQADADKLLKSLAGKPAADRRLKPGASLPFLALFTDPPADLSGQRVQLKLESAETATTR